MLQANNRLGRLVRALAAAPSPPPKTGARITLADALAARPSPAPPRHDNALPGKTGRREHRAVRRRPTTRAVVVAQRRAILSTYLFTRVSATTSLIGVLAAVTTAAIAYVAIPTAPTPRDPMALNVPVGTVTSVAFSPSRTSPTFATGSANGTVRLWNATTGATTATLQAGPSAVAAVWFSRDGRTLATGTADTVQLWDLSGSAGPTRLSTIRPTATAITAVAFLDSWTRSHLAPDDDWPILATGTSDGTVQLWDLTDRTHPTRRLTIGPQTGPVTAIAFSPDGRTLATGSAEGTVQLWDLTDRTHPTRRSTIGPQTGPVTAIAFSPDGRTLATGSGSDGRARLWDVPNSVRSVTEARDSIEPKAGAVTAVDFSPDGRTLATGTADGRVRLWTVSV